MERGQPSDQPFESRAGTYEGRSVRIPISSYTYKPLDQANNEIRLVEISPDLIDDGTIQCSLKHYSLLQPPTYVAISYEWGDPSQCLSVLIDGILVPITINLHHAMLQFRSHGVTLVWIDALCINQMDFLEKGLQILRMLAIYREARAVIAWLGPEKDGSLKVMRMLESLRKASKQSQSGLRRDNCKDLSADRLATIKPELQAFLRRSYWRRAWVIQEVSAGTKLSLFCGDHIAEWDDFALVLEHLYDSQRALDESARHVARLSDARVWLRENTPVSLLYALGKASEARSTEPKDKVYALLGLVYDHQKFVSEPRYGWTPEKLCRNMTRSYVIGRKSLDIIFFKSTQVSPELTLPSWCPDYLNYHPNEVHDRLARYIAGQDERSRMGKTSRQWCATGGQVAHKDLYAVEDDSLKTRGFRLSTIHSLSKNLLDDSMQHQYSDSQRGEYISGKPLYEAISRVLLLYNEDYTRHAIAPKMAYHLFKYDSREYREYRRDTRKDISVGKEKIADAFPKLKEWRQRNKDFLIFGKTLQHRAVDGRTAKEMQPLIFSLNYAPPKLTKESSKGLLSAEMKRLHHRGPLREKKPPPSSLKHALSVLSDLISENLRLLETTDSRIGWAHPHARVGDEIFLLAGCSMPAILRASDDAEGAYTVVGHAYLDQVMNNEKWENINPKELDFIHIR